MTVRWVVLGAAVATVSAAGLAGCTQSVDEASHQRQTEQAIIDGDPAGDAYAAVGAIVTHGPQWFSPISVLCSGTLIGPKDVLTARHCADAVLEAKAAHLQASFALGQHARTPEQLIDIGKVDKAPASPTHPGLLFDGGRDMAVIHLHQTPDGVQPAQLGEFTEEMIGTQFTIAGFGRDENNVAGLRSVGVATARSLGGTWYPLLFDGHFGQFLSWYFTDAATSIPPTREEAVYWWGAFELEPGFELLAGGLEGEALGCFGDSGGPLLLGDSAENLTVYGVDFAGEASQSEICTRGAAYIVNNATMLAFIDGAL